MFSPQAIQDMREHAISEYPNECCGYVLDGVYTPAKNVHPDPKNYFRIDPRTMAAAHKRGKVEAIVHSHPDGPYGPSFEDMKGQIASAVPWGIIYSRHNSASVPIWFGVGAEHPPLIGRPFLHGYTDCYTLVRAYFEQKLAIELPEFARQESWWDIDGVSSMYLDNAMATDFVQVDKLQPHDVILMSIRSPHNVPNHAAVYDGGDTIIHHLASRNSCKDDEGVSKWKKYVHSYWRHKSQVKE